MTERSKAIVSALPGHSGDGYSYGGSVILTIDTRSLMIGESREDYHFAMQLADAWNAYTEPADPFADARIATIARSEP